MVDSTSSIPVFYSAVHPDRDAEFRAIVPSRRIIREKKKEIVQACTTCGQTGDGEDVELKKCAGCKLVQYCSTKCQKANWPEHKRHCRSDLGEGIQPLIKSVTANPMLRHYIEVCLSFEFSLHRLHAIPAADRNKVIRAPLFAHMDVGVEPTKITDFMYLYTYKEEWDADDLEGMLQFHHLSAPHSWVPPRTPSPSNIAVWKQARELADEDGDEDCAVIVVQFVNNMKQAISCPVVVSKDALDEARKAEPFVMCSALTGKETKKPLSVASCLEFMNTHIRSDKTDRLQLRAPMRESDKELIRDAGRKKDAHAPEMLRLKMSRESVYVSHPSPGVPALASRTGSAPDDDAPDRLQIEGSVQAGRGQGEAGQQEPPKMNRNDRRRLEREQAKAQKRRK